MPQSCSPRQIKEAREAKVLSPHAARADQSLGRRVPEPQCNVRTAYERDIGRILYSLDFRRLRGKTQVFFNPRNDHICTRMEHVLYVRYIAKTIGSALALNQDLIEAIALAHDIGHTPFGHSGEKEIQKLIKEYGADFKFQHEQHSLRVIDVLAERASGKRGLNLTFEARDGVRTHCGEAYTESVLKPEWDKTPEELETMVGLQSMPKTLEGCCVRLADRIAYVGRDIEDAKRAGLMSFDEIPEHLQQELGRDNAEVINTLVTDVIAQSLDKDYLKLSQSKAEALTELLGINVKRIYLSPKIKAYERMATNCLRSLFEIFYEGMQDPERMRASKEEHWQSFVAYLEDHPEPEASDIRKLVDYLAGMTDHYAQATFEALFQF